MYRHSGDVRKGCTVLVYLGTVSSAVPEKDRENMQEECCWYRKDHANCLHWTRGSWVQRELFVTFLPLPWFLV